MLRSTVQNAPLVAALARLGHGDLVVVADCGLPCPEGVPVVDLALTRGVPTFEQVVRAITADAVFEGAAMAVESEGTAAMEMVVDLFAEMPELVSHEVLKELSCGAAVIVRTGETTPYANVILRAGVDF